MKINVEKFLTKKGNRVGKAAIEFEHSDGVLAGFSLVGFTICDDTEKGLFILFPSSIIKNRNNPEESKPFFFLRPSTDELLDKLETAILDEYDRVKGTFRNSPALTEVKDSVADVLGIK